MPRSPQEAKDSLGLLEAACNLVDALELGHAKLTNTTMAKLRNIRSTLDKQLDEEATKWQKEEEEEAKQDAKRKAEQEKFDKLSPAEQEKVSHAKDSTVLIKKSVVFFDTPSPSFQRKQLEKKRQQRKAQGKSVKAR